MAKLTRLVNGVLRSYTLDGESAIGNAQTSLVVNFPATLQTGNTTPRVIAWMVNTTDANPQFQEVEITARSATAFTGTWNAPTDTANYKLAYIVLDGWLI